MGSVVSVGDHRGDEHRLLLTSGTEGSKEREGLTCGIDRAGYRSRRSTSLAYVRDQVTGFRRTPIQTSPNGTGHIPASDVLGRYIGGRVDTAFNSVFLILQIQLEESICSNHADSRLTAYLRTYLHHQIHEIYLTVENIAYLSHIAITTLRS
jgi:hypothetical protein